MPPAVPVISVRMTKAVIKALVDLKKSADHCPDEKIQKQLVKIEKTLREALGGHQKGGMAPLNPAILNTSDLLDTRNPMDYGNMGRGLINIPAPFSDAVMGSGAVLTETTAPLYVPHSSPIAGGGKKTRKGKGNAK